jgi:fatty-acyl-CoA synthase
MSIPAFDWIACHAGARPTDVAMIDLATGRHISYAVMHDRIGCLAHALRTQCGVGRGDRVAVLAHNSTDMFEIQFACVRLGAVSVPMNWRLTVPELTFIVRDCEPVVLFHDPEFAEAAAHLGASCGIRHLIGRDTNDSGYERLIASAPGGITAEPVDHDDIMTILYTSGTTGYPKGAIITHGMRFWQTIKNGPVRLTADSTVLTVLPLFHAGGLDVWSNPVFHWGGRVVVTRAFDPAEVLRLLGCREMNITHFLGVPAHFLFMSQLPAFRTATFNPDLLAYVAAAPMPLAQLQAWAARGLAVAQLYGMTETSGTTVCLEPRDAVRKAGSAGRPCLHIALRLVRTDGSEAARGEIGEIWMKGPSVTPGYWKRPDATAAAITDGWLHSGDAAVIDEEGFITIVDRWKDMYISGGENVYPAEVEDLLYRLAAVAEVAVIGVPDERWGEVGRAIIALKPGHDLTEAEVMTYCDANLARYKHPRSIRFVAALPRNATGKVHKPTLRAQFGSA